MKVVLLYPPIANPRSPYLGLPSLAACLKAEGYDVVIRDLNLEFFYHGIDETIFQREDLGPDNVKLMEKQLELHQAKRTVLKGGNPSSDVKEAKKQLRWLYKKVFQRYEENLESDQDYETLTSYYQEEVIPWLRNEAPSYVGISMPFPSQYTPSFLLSRLIKREWPRLPIGIGGPQISKLHKDLSSTPEIFDIVDHMVIYEGERPIRSLLEALQKNKSISGVPNLIHRDKGQIIYNPTKDPEPLNHLPTPDFTGLPLDRYLMGVLMIPLMTTRGCYWGKCTFCTYREIHNRRVEKRDPSLIVKDMMLLSSTYQCRFFRIVDDAISPGTCKALARAILDADLDIKWKASARLEKAFTPELCRLMAEAGCDKVMFGLESYNQRILDRMGKGIRIADVKPILRHFKEAGIKTHLSCMVGFPTETREEAGQTRRFLEENRDLFTTWSAQTFNLEMGTEIDRCPEKFGITRIYRGDKIRRDLRYGYRFETESGITWHEAEEITRQIRDLVVTVDRCQSSVAKRKSI